MKIKQKLVDEIVRNVSREERARERQLCAESAMDWFTLPPRLRTKEKLREMILNRIGASK